MRKKSRPKTDPCGTPVLTFFQLDDCPLGTTRSHRSVKSDSIRQRSEPCIPLLLSL